MMSVLYSDIDWTKVEYVGFDMDGTLYDEYDFIKQAYYEINAKLINDTNILNFMLNRWLEKGSSYPFIFDEAYSKCQNIEYSKEEFISLALDIFRNFTPKLSLTNRSKDILNFCKKRYTIFLITDGNPILQRRKYKALKLSDYFDEKNVVFTGEYSKEYHKPNTKALDLLSIESTQSVFFGDRNNDMNFALSANMQFQKVYNMIKVK